MNAFTGATIAVFILMNVTFFFAYRMRRNDLADVVWGPGFIVAALGGLWAQSQNVSDYSLGLREILFLGCLSLWAIRLFSHIGLRNLKKSEEDVRYRRWREEWGPTWVWRSYLQVFLLQGIIMLVISVPTVLVVKSSPSPLDITVFAGVAIWIFGFVFETVGDRQLQKFTSDPSNKGKIMNKGLWSWSRHPNYFGEVTQWWGLFLMALTLPQGALAIISPLTITFLILKVSGVPMLEELMKDRPGYQEYAAKTSVFVPFPPKKNVPSN